MIKGCKGLERVKKMERREKKVETLLSSITKQLDSPNDSTPPYALLCSEHVPTTYNGPPRQLLCARYAYISSNTPTICLSITRILDCCFEVLFYPGLLSSAVRCSCSPHISLHAEAVTDILREREQCAKYALFMRRENENSKWNSCTLPPSSP